MCPLGMFKYHISAPPQENVCYDCGKRALCPASAFLQSDQSLFAQRIYDSTIAVHLYLKIGEAEDGLRQPHSVTHTPVT